MAAAGFVALPGVQLPPGTSRDVSRVLTSCSSDLSSDSQVLPGRRGQVPMEQQERGNVGRCWADVPSFKSGSGFSARVAPELVPDPSQ